MIWNLILHSAAGAAGYGIFTFHYPGILYCLGITVIVQGIDMFRYYSKLKNRISESSGKSRSKMLKKYKSLPGFILAVLWFLMKVVFYGLLTLVTAFIVRSIIM